MVGTSSGQVMAIRAVQGGSKGAMQGRSSGTVLVTSEEIRRIWHGTTQANYEYIRKEGLIPGGRRRGRGHRDQNHFSALPPTAKPTMTPEQHALEVQQGIKKF